MFNNSKPLSKSLVLVSVLGIGPIIVFRILGVFGFRTGTEITKNQKWKFLVQLSVRNWLYWVWKRLRPKNLSSIRNGNNRQSSLEPKITKKRVFCYKKLCKGAVWYFFFKLQRLFMYNLNAEEVNCNGLLVNTLHPFP